MQPEVFDLDEVGIAFLVFLKDCSASHAISAYAFVLIDAHFVNAFMGFLLVCDLVKVDLARSIDQVLLLLLFLEVYVPRFFEEIFRFFGLGREEKTEIGV